jgi:hypothetical protein
MNRRMEDRIRKLCVELTTEKDPARVRDLSTQLSAALHSYVETLRQKVLAYPITTERRLSEASAADSGAAVVPKIGGAAN